MMRKVNYITAALLWDITQRRVAIPLPTFWDNISVPSARAKKSDGISRNVGEESHVYAP